MNPIKDTQEIIKRACEFIKDLPVQNRNSYLSQMSKMEMRLEQPCVLAIAGKVKAGKSSFLNALIGTNLAKVGLLETTATINKFCYGVPEDPERPVKVVWENGMETYETLGFMDSLQGHDAETLKRAEGIAYLEYRLEHEMLKEITLVDTPGTDAVVGDNDDAHQAITETFFNLRRKHSEQTESCISSADAVVYLVGAVATTNAKRFLDDFQNVSSCSSALNAIGVLSKIDIDTTLLERRQEQADYVAGSLREQLNTVIPASAGLYQAIVQYEHKFEEWQKIYKDIPFDAFEFLMESESLFLKDDDKIMDLLYADSEREPLTLDERKALRVDLPWSIFRTIATELYHAKSLDEAKSNLKDIANMDKVRSVVKEQFFNRSKIIRCYRILSELKKITDTIRRNDFYELRLKANDACVWLNMIDTCYTDDKEHADSLRAFVLENSKKTEEIDRLEKEFRRNVVIPLEETLLKLEEYDQDYQMLKRLQKDRNQWSVDEYQELCQLFGLYGERMIKDGVSSYERQHYWMERSNVLTDSQMKMVAEHAVSVYGEL